jgi:hypothetical protein
VQASHYRDLVNTEAMAWNKDAQKAVRKAHDLGAMDPALSRFHPGGNLGSTSEEFAQALKKVSWILQTSAMCIRLETNVYTHSSRLIIPTCSRTRRMIPILRSTRSHSRLL